MNCIPPTEAAAPAPEQGHIPRRNLSEAFEELYIDNTNATTTPAASTKQPPSSSEQNTTNNLKKTNLISPTGVAEFHHDHSSEEQSNPVTPTAKEAKDTEEEEVTAAPYFYLHPDLKRDLSQAVINRVMVYGVIHDINKEAMAMAANDDSAFATTVSNNPEDINEECSPLVEAVKGPAATNSISSINTTVLQNACIDEERWLLSAIELRGEQGEDRPVQACPPTFLQAMGEREYENPLTSLSNGSRTQLWKPSRSWWEAKSGKNPWIEPKSHNKRWRYLWPLIHYHKFLAKCIKKLKRNGVDVKMSVSPVAAFLREEVCAVSDHLASVSLFDSEEWMACLAHFHGWTDTTQGSEEKLRHLVSKLKLKPLAEHGDVDSPLLRSQIDEQFLKAMAEQRKQMEMGGEQQQDRRKLGSAKVTPTNSNKRPPNPAHNGARMDNVPNQVGGTGAGGPPTRNTGVRRQRMAPGYPYHPQWWGHGWAPHQHPQAHQFPPPHHGADDGSVHSSLSGDGTFADYGMYPGAPGPNGQFYYPGAFHPHPAAAVGLVDNAAPGYDPNVMTHESSMYMGPPQPYHPDHAGLGFFGHPPVDPSMAYGVNQQYQDEVALQYGVPPSLAHNITPSSPQQEPPPSPDHGGPDYSNAADDQTPYKYKTPRSPYWSHLDATIAMGLSTPQTTTKQIRNADPAAQDDAEAAAAAANAQPLLLRQSQYYGYGPVSNYGPPSPATQFMMSPQANFAYNYGYGYSPSHNNHHMPHYNLSSPMPPGERNKRRQISPSLKEAAPGRSPPVRRDNKDKHVREVEDPERESPATVDTITESESCSEAA